MASKPIILSGIQPTGQLMIGNYLGAIKNWVGMLDSHQCLFAIVDLHAFTTRQDPMVLKQQCFDILALYVACGLDPNKCTLFLQSHVKAHAELGWLLNCFTYIGELNRMTQFKDKSQKNENNINAGLFTYPVLQAADILLYRANLVPVGGDQKQHLELCRDIAIRFNHQYGDVLTIPEPFIPPVGARIMSLQDPSKKMSKSDENKQNFIALLDEPAVIRKKFKRAVTDSEREIRYDPENKAAISNLLTLYSTLAGKTIQAIEKEYENSGYGDFKKDLGDVVVDYLTPIQQRYQEIRDDETLLKTIMAKGAENASEMAEPTLNEVKKAMGLILP